MNVQLNMSQLIKTYIFDKSNIRDKLIDVNECEIGG